MEPKISIIIPIYNTEKHLQECVESVRRQTLRDIEIILVDDESPDKAPQLCDEYVAMDSRIKVVHKKNGGLGFARNSGLDVATGEYVSFIDSDDFIKPEMMQTLYETAKKYDADEVRSGTIFYDNGKTQERKDVKDITVFRGQDEVKRFIFDLLGPLPEEPRDVKYMMSVWLAIHKRSVIEDNHVRFTSERETLSEDMIFNLDLFPKMDCIVCIPDCFYNYRMNPNSLTHTFSMEKYRRTHVFLRLVRERLEDAYGTEDFDLHYKRLCFLYLRNNITSSIHTKDAISIKLRNIGNIIHDPLWDDLLANYPFRRMNIKHRFYFQLIRSKRSFPIALVSKIVFR